MPTFHLRSGAAEIMDDPAVDPEEMRAALRELERINRWLGGYSTSLAAIARLLRGRTAGVPSSIRLLDVGCGGGDVTEAIVRWAARRGVLAEVTAIDISNACVSLARDRLSSLENVDVRVADLFELDPSERFDVVHSALVLHHFPGEDAARALRAMWDRARWGVVVNDLHRHALAWHGIRLVAGLFSNNRLIRHDGPLSVLRAFSRRDWDELARKADLPLAVVRWRWAFRWSVIFARDALEEDGR